MGEARSGGRLPRLDEVPGSSRMPSPNGPGLCSSVAVSRSGLATRLALSAQASSPAAAWLLRGSNLSPSRARTICSLRREGPVSVSRVGQLRATGAQLPSVPVAAAAASVHPTTVRIRSHDNLLVSIAPGGDGGRVRLRPHCDHRTRYRCSALGQVRHIKGLVSRRRRHLPITVGVTLEEVTARIALHNVDRQARALLVRGSADVSAWEWPR
jgi:hypothetical protein